MFSNRFTGSVVYVTHTHTHTHTHTNALNRIDQSDKSYIFFDEDWQDLADFIARLSNFDNDEFSPLHKLNQEIARGKDVLSKDDVIDALIKAESVIIENSNIADEQIVQIADMFNELVDAIVYADEGQEDDMSMRNCTKPCNTQSLCDDSALKIKKILCVLNKAIFCDVAVFRDEAIFAKHVTMKDSLDVEGKARIHKLHAKEARIHELEAKKAKIHRLKADRAKIQEIEACDLNVTCTAIIENAIINNADINTVNIDTANINNLNVGSETVCDLIVDCNIFMQDSISPAIGNIYKGGDRFLHNFGVNNTFVGENSGNFTMAGSDNAGFGTNVLQNNTTGFSNVAVGPDALLNTTDSFQNVAIGDGAMEFALGSGDPILGNASSNVAIGINALQNTQTGQDDFAFPSTLRVGSVAMGAYALQNNTTGFRNVAIGWGAMFQNIDGVSNVAVGAHALQNNTNGGVNVAIGTDALRLNTEGSINTAVGRSAMLFNTIGNVNTAVGFEALRSNTEGFDNTAIGSQALWLNTTGRTNTAVGVIALVNNTTGIEDVAVGSFSLFSNTTGTRNTAVGVSAMQGTGAGIGSNNVAMGRSALFSIDSGNHNTAIGQRALRGVTSGNNNTVVGSYVGAHLLATGSNNTLLGFDAGTNLAAAAANNIIIGNVGVAGDNNRIRIGTIGTHTTNFQAGIFGAGPIVGAAVLVDAVTGQLGTVPSSIRYKENVQDMCDASSAILNLRPVTFNYKSDETKSQQFGLVAEEVQQVLPALVVRGADGEIETVKYHELAVLLLNELIKLKQEHAETKARLALLESKA